MVAERTQTQTTTFPQGGKSEPPLRPPSARGVSIRPAMVVLGLAVLILGLFITLGVVTSTRVAPVRTSSAPSRVPGSALRAVAGADPLAPIVGDGQPPSDVLNAVFVPTGSVRLSSANDSASAGQYDKEVTLRSTASQGALLTFFANDMRLEGWQVFDRGPARARPGCTRGARKDRRLRRVLLGDGCDRLGDHVRCGRAGRGLDRLTRSGFSRSTTTPEGPDGRRSTAVVRVRPGRPGPSVRAAPVPRVPGLQR